MHSVFAVDGTTGPCLLSGYGWHRRLFQSRFQEPRVTPRYLFFRLESIPPVSFQSGGFRCMALEVRAAWFWFGGVHQSLMVSFKLSSANFAYTELLSNLECPRCLATAFKSPVCR
jgi:hypothetical protein